jgi:hypothetical protein
MEDGVVDRIWSTRKRQMCLPRRIVVGGTGWKRQRSVSTQGGHSAVEISSDPRLFPWRIGVDCRPRNENRTEEHESMEAARPNLGVFQCLPTTALSKGRVITYSDPSSCCHPLLVFWTTTTTTSSSAASSPSIPPASAPARSRPLVHARR